MQTLYDLLEALPKDGGEELRTAFRKAVKGAHPDLHPGDPNAALKFRQIVRASEILGDSEQRAAYDHLLDLAQQEAVSVSGQATAIRIHKFASGVIALAGASAVTVGGYLLLMHMSAAMMAPPEKIAPTRQASAAFSPLPPEVMTGMSAPTARDARTGMAREAVEPNTIIAVVDSSPAPDLSTRDPGPSRPRAVFASPNRAIADPASLPEPKFSPANVARGVSLDRLREFDRAFADVEPATQQERPGRARSASAESASTLASVPRSGRTPREVVPVPRQRPVAPGVSRLESAALLRPR